MGVSLKSVEIMLRQHKSEFIFIKDKNSKFIEANDIFLAFHGFHDVEKLRDKSDYDLPLYDFADQYINDDKTTLRFGELQIIEPTRGHDGNVCFVLTNKHSFFDPKTQQSGIFGISTILNCSTTKKLSQIIKISHLHDFKISSSLFKEIVNQNIPSPLTERELDVLYYFLHGLSQKKIADKLNLSIRTIEDHIDHIKYKLKCGNKDQIFDFAIYHGLMNVVPRHLL